MQGPAPLVTIVVITFDRGPSIRRCLATLVAQTHRPLEVVVVDDGSTDDTAATVEAFAGTAPEDVPVRLVRHAENRGIGAARNTGIDAARGEYVAFTDDDGEARPDWIERLVGWAEREPDAWVFGGSIVDPGERTWAQRAAEGMHHLRDEPGPVRSIVGGNMLFRASFLADHRFDPDCRYGADELDLCFTAARLGGRVWCDPGAAVVHHHRRTVSGYLRQQWKRGRGSVWVRWKHRRGLWPNKHWAVALLLASPLAFLLLAPALAAAVVIAAAALLVTQTLALDLQRGKPLVAALVTLPLVLAGYLVEFAGALRAVVQYRLPPTPPRS